MKKLILLGTIVLANLLNAQIPQGFSYQAVAFNSSGNPVSNSSVSVRLSILDNSATGTNLYTETHNKTTNANGLYSLTIGQGTPTSGTFNTINWALNPKFLKVELDPAGGTTYTTVGTSQFLSVPFALVADSVLKAPKQIIDFQYFVKDLHPNQVDSSYDNNKYNIYGNFGWNYQELYIERITGIPEDVYVEFIGLPSFQKPYVYSKNCNGSSNPNLKDTLKFGVQYNRCSTNTIVDNIYKFTASTDSVGIPGNYSYKVRFSTSNKILYEFNKSFVIVQCNLAAFPSNTLGNKFSTSVSCGIPVHSVNFQDQFFEDRVLISNFLNTNKSISITRKRDCNGNISMPSLNLGAYITDASNTFRFDIQSVSLTGGTYIFTYDKYDFNTNNLISSGCTISYQ